MFNSRSAIYGLKGQARSVAAVEAEEERHRFLVGTQSRKEPNEVHLVEFDEDDNVILRRGLYRHPAGEVWSLAGCPGDAAVFASTHSAGSEGFGATVWRAPAEEDAAAGGAARGEEVEEEAAAAAAGAKDEARDLEEVARLGGHQGRVNAVVWGPADTARAGALVTLDQTRVRLWDAEAAGGGGAATAESEALAGGPEAGYLAGCWDPHHADLFVSAHGRSLTGWDLRTMRPSQGVQDAHDGTVRGVDYNPNKPYHVVSAAEDRTVRFWDLRKADRPLRTLAKHTHWVWNVRYNRFHDQLVLSSGTDSYVNLWSIVSVSSAPLGDLEDPANEREGDKLIKTYDEHEDSVYAIAWSCCDAWVFASLSYDGRLVINHVPPAEKYKILL